MFLLGPRALFWLSLFSICVEESVTIRLPCLQETAQRDLLARLTYLVGVAIFLSSCCMTTIRLCLICFLGFGVNEVPMLYCN